jgi:hypothetical protein
VLELIDETNRKAAVELAVTFARPDLILVLGACPEGLGTFVEIANLPPDEQATRCSNRRTWLNTSAHTNTPYDPARTPNSPSRSVLNRTVVEPRGPSEGTENVKAPSTGPPAWRRRPTTPVVGRTLTLRGLTTVAVPAIRLPTRRTESPDTTNPDDARALRAPTSRATACHETRALAATVNNTEAPITPASKSGNQRPAEPPSDAPGGPGSLKG